MMSNVAHPLSDAPTYNMRSFSSAPSGRGRGGFYNGDSRLLQPVAFVKASSSLPATRDAPPSTPPSGSGAGAGAAKKKENVEPPRPAGQALNAQLEMRAQQASDRSFEEQAAMAPPRKAGLGSKPRAPQSQSPSDVVVESTPEPTTTADASNMDLEEEQPHPAAVDAEVVAISEPAVAETTIDSVVPAPSGTTLPRTDDEIELALAAERAQSKGDAEETETSISVPAGFVLGLDSAPVNGDDVNSDDDDDDDEEVVLLPDPAAQLGAVGSSSALAKSKADQSHKTSGYVTESDSSVDDDGYDDEDLRMMDEELEAVKKPKKLTKGQKRALRREGKKARRKGVPHARSGNAHLLIPGLDSPRQEGELESDEGEQEHVDGAPRMGDSDVEWGSDGGAAHQERRRRSIPKSGRAARREHKKMDRLSADVRADLEQQQQVLSRGDAGSSFKRSTKTAGPFGGQRAADEDYAANILASLQQEDSEDAETGDHTGEQGAKAFLAGIQSLNLGNPVRIDDIDASSSEEDSEGDTNIDSDEWEDESGSDDDSEDIDDPDITDDDDDSDVQHALELALGEADAA